MYQRTVRFFRNISSGLTIKNRTRRGRHGRSTASASSNTSEDLDSDSTIRLPVPEPTKLDSCVPSLKVIDEKEDTKVVVKREKVIDPCDVEFRPTAPPYQPKKHVAKVKPLPLQQTQRIDIDADRVTHDAKLLLNRYQPVFSTHFLKTVQLNNISYVLANKLLSSCKSRVLNIGVSNPHRGGRMPLKLSYYDLAEFIHSRTATKMLHIDLGDLAIEQVTAVLYDIRFYCRQLVQLSLSHDCIDLAQFPAVWQMPFGTCAFQVNLVLLRTQQLQLARPYTFDTLWS